MKKAIGRGGRPLDVEATKAARTRHAAGRKILDRIFNGDDPEFAVKQDAVRRRTQGQGPAGRGQHTRRHWTRAGRREAGRAARKARRANRP